MNNTFFLYIVDCLHVKHIIVCGHYGCGGVLATLNRSRVGLVDNWLRHVDDVIQKHRYCLSCIDDHSKKGNRLCELNTIEQAYNVCRTTVVRDAWSRGQPLVVHAFIYGLSDGRLHDLHMTCTSEHDIESVYENAVQMLVSSGDDITSSTMTTETPVDV